MGKEIAEPLGLRRPPHSWEEMLLEQRNDWWWKIARYLSSKEELSKVINLTPWRSMDGKTLA
jgi:L-lysine 2,3-aminomutase